MNLIIETRSLNSVLFVVQSLSHVWLSEIPWTAALQASLSFIISRSLLKFLSIESMTLSKISSLVAPFSSCPQSFPASRSFLMSWLFTSGGPSIGASASVFPMNIQDWFPLTLTGLISLQSKGLFLQHRNSKASILWCSAFFMVRLSHPYMMWWVMEKAILEKP